MDSEVLWLCEPAVSASVCLEVVCVNVAPGGTHPPPPGRLGLLLALPPPEPPAGLGGHLGGEEKQ